MFKAATFSGSLGPEYSARDHVLMCHLSKAVNLSPPVGLPLKTGLIVHVSSKLTVRK